MFVPVPVVLSAIIHGPRSIVVIDGSKATFTCVTDLAVDQLCWNYTIYRSAGSDTTLCNSIGCRSAHYSVDTSVHNRRRRHSFMIDSCNATHSGHYVCGACVNPQTTKTAYLVVLGTFIYRARQKVTPRKNLISGIVIFLPIYIGYRGGFRPHILLISS